MALPSTYTRLNYIGTTGTQYIDTGFKPNQKTRVVMDFQSDNNACHLFGARTSFQNKGFLICWNTNFNYCVQVANKCFNGGSFDEKTRHTADMTASEFKLDGVSQATYTVDEFQTEYNLYLASCPNSNESENMQGKIYSCQVYDNSTLIRDFIPCKNASGTVGMWDNVNSVFYDNAGTGSFVNGGEVNSGGSDSGGSYGLPNGYTQLEYIESSGTQYIDTNVSLASSGVRIDCDFQFTKYVDNTFVIRPYYNGEIYAIGLYNNNFHTANVTMSQSSNMLARTTATGSTSASVNMTLKIFAQHVYGSNIENYAYVRLYSCKIYSNNTIVRDFIPCKNASGTVGLWDAVNSVFYSNAGTGSFIAGAVVDPTVPKDKHNTLFDGISYAITGGRCLVNGTGYEIAKGRTLIGGTGYDINFTRWFTITMTGSLNTSSQSAYNSYVEINGVRYSSAATVEVEEGTVIFAHIVCTGSETYSGIFLNGKHWNTSTGADGPFYYTVKSDVSMKMQKLSSVYSQLDVFDANYQS